MSFGCDPPGRFYLNSLDRCAGGGNTVYRSLYESSHDDNNNFAPHPLSLIDLGSGTPQKDFQPASSKHLQSWMFPQPQPLSSLPPPTLSLPPPQQQQQQQPQPQQQQHTKQVLQHTAPPPVVRWISSLPFVDQFPSAWLLGVVKPSDHVVDKVVEGVESNSAIQWDDACAERTWSALVLRLSELSRVSCVDRAAPVRFAVRHHAASTFSHPSSSLALKIRLEASDSQHLHRTQATMFVCQSNCYPPSSLMTPNLVLVAGSTSGDRNVFQQLRALLCHSLLCSASTTKFSPPPPPTILWRTSPPLPLPLSLYMDDVAEISATTNATVITLLDMCTSDCLDVQLEGFGGLATLVQTATEACCFAYWTRDTVDRFLASMNAAAVSWKGCEDVAHLASRILSIAQSKSHRLAISSYS